MQSRGLFCDIVSDDVGPTAGDPVGAFVYLVVGIFLKGGVGDDVGLTEGDPVGTLVELVVRFFVGDRMMSDSQLVN